MVLIALSSVRQIMFFVWGGGGGLRSPKPEKIGVKLRKIAVKIAVHFFFVPRLYASHEQQWSTRFFAKRCF